MEVFNALWDNPEQSRRPSNDNFQMFTAEEWISHSSTYKLLSGNFSCPLPPEVERGQSSNVRKQTSQAQNMANHSKPKVPQTNIKRYQNDKSENLHKLKVYIPGQVKLPFLPRMSSLSWEEQRDCLALLLKFEGRLPSELTAPERAEHQLFLSLYKRVKEEQKEFLEVAKSHWHEYINRTCNLKKDPLNFVDQLWMVKVQSALKRYPRNFKKFKVLSLAYKDMPAAKVCLIRNLLNIGRIPHVKLPEFEHPFRVATTKAALRSWGLLNVNSQSTDGTLHRVPVSADPNAEHLARLNNVHVVISSSGLKCLLNIHENNQGMNNSFYNKSWKLPVTVKEYRSFENGKPTNKTLIFIDKALPPTDVTGPEKVMKYYKHALLAAVVHRFSEKGKNFDIKGEEYLFKKEYDPELQSAHHSPCATSEIEDCYSDPHFTSSPCKASKKETNSAEYHLDASTAVQQESGSLECTSTARTSGCEDTPVFQENLSSSPSCHSKHDDSDDESKLVMDVDDQDAENNSKGYHDDTVGTANSTSSSPSKESVIHNETNQESSQANVHCDQVNRLLDTNLKISEQENESQHVQTKPPTTDESIDHSSSTHRQVGGSNKSFAAPVKVVNGHALPLNITNVIYNLWTVHQENQPSNPINFLVRNHMQGSLSLGKGQYQDTCLACKPEFQMEFGAEVVSLSDLSRQWTDLFFHPGADLSRVRVNVETAEMVKLEKKSLLGLQNEANDLYGVDITETFSALYSVFSDLLSLPCGQYLLCSNSVPRKEAELLIKTSGDGLEDASFSLKYGNSPQCIPCDVPWQPLDTNVILPRNMFFKSLPCTFITERKTATRPKRIVPKPVPSKSKSDKKKKKKDPTINNI